MNTLEVENPNADLGLDLSGKAIKGNCIATLAVRLFKADFMRRFCKNSTHATIGRIMKTNIIRPDASVTYMAK